MENVISVKCIRPRISCLWDAWLGLVKQSKDQDMSGYDVGVWLLRLFIDSTGDAGENFLRPGAGCSTPSLRSGLNLKLHTNMQSHHNWAMTCVAWYEKWMCASSCLDRPWSSLLGLQVCNKQLQTKLRNESLSSPQKIMKWIVSTSSFHLLTNEK